MADENLEQYREAVSLLVLDFQWIEEYLKILIAGCYEAIRRAGVPGVHYALCRKDYENDSLGKLISRYSKLTDNPSLIAELRNLAPHRNFCVHTSFILSIEEQTGTAVIGATSRMNSLHDRTKACIMALMQEVQERADQWNQPVSVVMERGSPATPPDDRLAQ